MTDAILTVEDYVTQLTLNEGHPQRPTHTQHTDVVELQPPPRSYTLPPQFPHDNLNISLENISSRHNNNPSRNSIVSHLNIVEAVTAENSQHSSIPEEQNNHSPPRTKQKQKMQKKTKRKERVPCNIFLKHASKISQYALGLMSFCLVILFPLHYSFIRDLFRHSEQYRMTYLPPLPKQLYLTIPICLCHLIYLILYGFYMRKYLRRQSIGGNLKICHLYRMVTCLTFFQVIVTFLWTDGLNLATEVEERFRELSDFEEMGAVSLLLKWRFLWTINTFSWLLDVIILLLYYAMRKYLK